ASLGIGPAWQAGRGRDKPARRERRRSFANGCAGFASRGSLAANDSPLPGAPMTDLPASPRLRRLAADVALWAAVGVVMAFLGPFGTAERPLGERLAYWEACMVGGGLIGVAIDAPVARRVRSF